MSDFRILEITKENKNMYLNQITELEQKVLKDMELSGRAGQLFITGKEDIEEYINSNFNTVVSAINSQNEVIAVSYITQNQKPFTYNDITKYFKYGDEYKEYVKDSYDSDEKYKLDILNAYKLKIKAYEYAKNKVLMKHQEHVTIYSFLEHELEDKENRFHEKSQLREELNSYMVEYIEKNYPETKELYEKFYWITIPDIEKEFGRSIDAEKINNQNIREYERIMKSGKLKIYYKPQYNVEKYFGANTENSIEIDTYITSPENRQNGIARSLVYEGIKKHMQVYFLNQENKEIYLCSTLHKSNLSSKYVSEFFGLKDNLFVNRRQGRDREVHICKVTRENAQEYLDEIEKKLIILYGYNPDKKQISKPEEVKVLKEQLQYEKNEIQRLSLSKKRKKSRFKEKGILKEKRKKVSKLRDKIKKVKTDMYRGEQKQNERD